MSNLQTEKFEKPSENLSFLSNVSLFSKLPQKIIEEFAKVAQPITYDKGEMIFLEEEEAKFFYVIKYGWVKLYHETFDGVEAIIDILTNNHLFGESAIFENDLNNSSAQAVEDTKLLAIPLSVLKSQIKESPEVAMGMISSMSKYRKRQEKEIEHLTIQNAPQRVGCFLLRLCPVNRQENIIINLPYDKLLLASRLGMKPETFSRALQTLRNTIGIRVSGARIEIDNISQLVGFSCSACSSSYPCQDII